MPPDRWLIGISGIPGSGKSTFAKAVAAQLNELHGDQQHQPWAVAVGMDGASSPPSKVLDRLLTAGALGLKSLDSDLFASQQHLNSTGQILQCSRPMRE